MMDRSLRAGTVPRDAEPPRCPECGAGELFLIDVARRDGGVWQGAYCAGLYDHVRRRLLARSCGYAGARVLGPSEDPDRLPGLLMES
ncbi:MAG: hypothetical protein DMF51_12810 [Acidobacteria bacterium]|nr:MAG: hypothetical protein DMF51_12810 [Acidobacteriota bacterium]